MFNKSNAQKVAKFQQNSNSIIAPMKKMAQDLEIQNGEAEMFEQDLDAQIQELMELKQTSSTTRVANAQFVDKMNNLFGILPEVTEEEDDNEEEVLVD